MGRIESSCEIPWAFISSDADKTAEQDEDYQQDSHFKEQSSSFSDKMPEHLIASEQIPLLC